MKKSLILLAITLISLAAFSQDKMNHKVGMHKHSMGKMHGKMQDCVMMEDGKVMVMKGGNTMPLDADLTLKNGTTVMTDGTVKMKNGTTKMLQDGQCVYMNGKMGMMKMGKMKGYKMDKM